jgi:hypothetical protein
MEQIPTIKSWKLSYPKDVTSKDFKFNDDLQIMEVAGQKYSYQMFNELGVGGMDTRTVFRVLERKDNDLCIQRLNWLTFEK